MVRHDQRGISLPDDDAPDVTMDIAVYGDDVEAVEKTLMHAKDQGIRAMQALNTGEHPDDCDGGPMRVAWDRVLDDGGEE